ncbi:excalibur calcium-binding domain-containing protein [Streptomyces sp. NPDC001415]
MRISSPAVRTLLISGLLGALAFTTTGCQDDSKPVKPAAGSPTATPSASPSPTPSAVPSESPSATPASTPAAPTPPAPELPPKPKTNGPSLPPPMNGGGGDGGGGTGGGDSGGGDSVYYKNCAAVRAAGAAPLHRGEPGYAAHLDRDGDGIACER